MSEGLLFLAHRIPFPPNKGDKIRSYHLLKHLAERYQVHLGTFIDDPDDWQYVDAVKKLCGETHFARLDSRMARAGSATALLRNRPLDVWMHEQDVRRALHMPGNLDSAPAVHSADYLMESLPFVVGKRAQAPVGSVVRLEVTGHDPVTVAVGEDGRGRPATPEDGEPTVTLTMDRETLVVLAGGRRASAADDVRLTGDTELGERVVASLGVTP